MIHSNGLRRNLEAVQTRISLAAQRAGRQAGDVTLVVVTKGHPVAVLGDLVELGSRDLGESYLGEALSKQETLGKVDGLHWHMIGHVQSRKAAEVAAHFDLVHSVDSLKLSAPLE